MNTLRSTGSANVQRAQQLPRASAATGQWWKAWVLLTSLGATALGWMAFTTDEPQVAHVTVAPEAPSMPTQITPVPRVRRFDEPRPLPPSAGTLPAMPQKPVFQTPVTRTRRS